MKDTDTYKHRVTNTHAGSRKFGPCEVCGGQVDVTYYRTTMREYIDPETGQQEWTYYKVPGAAFGHKDCVESEIKEGDLVERKE